MRKILIADDESIERKGLRCLVETIGGEFEIREAKNGREALAEAKKMQPDIVLTDIKMPFMDGVELAEKISDIRPDTVTILVSGYSDFEYARRGLQCGVRDYILMPFMDGVELAEKISDIRPDTVTILVSGYSDFEYARRGLQCGVRDYILKPVDPKVFTEVFLKAVDEVEQKKETGMQMQKNHEFLEEYFLLQFLYKGAKEIQREAAGLLNVSWWEKVRRVVILETLDSFFDEYDEEFRAKLAEELKLPFFYLNIDINRSVLLFTDNVKVDYPVLGNHIHSFARQTFRQDVYVAISEQLESGMINRSVLLFTDNVKVDYPVLGNHIHSFARQTFRQDVYVAISEQLESGMDMPVAYRRVEGLMENRFYRREEWVFTDEGSNDDFSEKFSKLFDAMEEDIRLAYRRVEGLMENRFYRREEWVFTDEGSNDDFSEKFSKLFDAMEEDIRLRDIAHLWEHFHALTGSRQMGGLHSQIFTKFSGSKIVDLKNSPSCLTQWKKTSVFGILRICGNIFMRLPEADRWAAYIPRYLQNFPAQKSLTFYIRICAVLRKSATRLLKKYISAG